MFSSQMEGVSTVEMKSQASSATSTRYSLAPMEFMGGTTWLGSSRVGGIQCVVVRDHTVAERGAGPGVDSYPAAQAVAAVAARAAGAAPGGVAVELAVRDLERRIVRDA